MGTTKTTETSSGTNKIELPDWVNKAGESLIGAAQKQMDTPYKAYTGDKVADIGRDEEQAFNTVRANQEKWGANMVAADGMIGNAVKGYGDVGGPALAANANDITTGRWDSAAADRYMNPYIDRVMAAKTKNLEAARDLTLRNQSLEKAKTGNWGGARHGVADAGTQGAFANTLETSQAASYNDAWDRALAAYGGDEGRALDAGKANADNFIRVGLANQTSKNDNTKAKLTQFNAEADRMRAAIGDQRDNAKAKQDLAFNDADSLFKIGLVKRDNEQQTLDGQYEEWKNGEDKFYKDAGLLSSALGTVPTNKTETSNSTSNSTSTAKSSTLSKIMGGASIAASFF